MVGMKEAEPQKKTSVYKIQDALAKSVKDGGSLGIKRPAAAIVVPAQTTDASGAGDVGAKRRLTARKIVAKRGTDAEPMQADLAAQEPAEVFFTVESTEPAPATALCRAAEEEGEECKAVVGQHDDSSGAASSKEPADAGRDSGDSVKITEEDRGGANSADEMCRTVAETLKGASCIPEGCHDMFSSMAFACLLTPAANRHPYQVAAIGAVLAKAMVDIEVSLQEAASHAAAQVLTAEKGAQASTEEKVRAAQAVIEQRTEELQAARRESEEAKEALGALAEKGMGFEEEFRLDEEELEACLGALAVEIPLVKDGATIVRKGTFERPDDPKHIAVLDPLLRRIGFEDALLIALPVAAAKPLAARGDFDRMVMLQIAQRLQEHADAKRAKLEASPATLAAHEESVLTAHALCASAEEARQQAEAALEAAEADKSREEAAFEETKQAAVLRAEAGRDAARAALAAFQEGPGAAFRSLVGENSQEQSTAVKAGQQKALPSAPSPCRRPSRRNSDAALPTPCRASLDASLA